MLSEAHFFAEGSKKTGWWFQTFFIFHFIYGMSSFPLTNSIIFQDGHIAPPTRKHFKDFHFAR
jgi:hypothetical protein